MRFPSVLGFRCSHDQTVQARIDINLTCQPRRVPQLSHQIQHIHFARRARANPISPDRIDVDVAGCAGAVAAAIAVNALDPMVSRRAHERCARGNLDGAALTIEGNECYFRHIYQIVIDVISNQPYRRPRIADSQISHAQYRSQAASWDG